MEIENHERVCGRTCDDLGRSDVADRPASHQTSSIPGSVLTAVQRELQSLMAFLERCAIFYSSV